MRSKFDNIDFHETINIEIESLQVHYRPSADVIDISLQTVTKGGRSVMIMLVNHGYDILKRYAGRVVLYT